MAKNKRIVLTVEEKLLRAVQAIFIIQALQMKMGGHDVRKILGVGMKEITPIKKAVDKTLKKYGKNAQKRNS
jgi:hypothetical protein